MEHSSLTHESTSSDAARAFVSCRVNVSVPGPQQTTQRVPEEGRYVRFDTRLSNGRRVGLRAVCAGLVVVLGFARPARADEARFWDRDDALHFSASALIAGAAFAASTSAWDSRLAPSCLALSVTLAVGASKEASDALGLGDASWKDFAWDFMGAVVGTTLALAIDTAVRPAPVPR